MSLFHSPDMRGTVGIDERGLVLGAGTRVVRMAKAGCLALDADRDRLRALLSIAWRRPVGADVIHHIAVASSCWHRGDKALANFRLLFAGLPLLAGPDDAHRLSLAERLLDHGMSPTALLKELGLDTASCDILKYDPDQPRVPAGHGRDSGRWESNGGDISIRPSGPITPQPPAHGIRVAANGPFKPEGIEAAPSPPINPLDPLGLNKEPPSPQEQQAIVDTLNTIRGGVADDIKKLGPHPYQNLPHRMTGAILPPIVGAYTSYTVRLGADRARGESRLITDQSMSHVYYTSNHYYSFYGVDLDDVSK